MKRWRTSQGGDEPAPAKMELRRSRDMGFEPPSGYEAMWLFAMFDLPMKTPMQRRIYTHFRKFLLREGFSRLQFSVYARYCVSDEASVVHGQRIRDCLPPEGQVRLLAVTERQFGKQRIFMGLKQKCSEAAPVQLMMF